MITHPIAPAVVALLALWPAVGWGQMPRGNDGSVHKLLLDAMVRHGIVSLIHRGFEHSVCLVPLEPNAKSARADVVKCPPDVSALADLQPDNTYYDVPRPEDRVLKDPIPLPNIPPLAGGSWGVNTLWPDQGCLTLTLSPGSHINDIGNLSGYAVTLNSAKNGGVTIEVCGASGGSFDGGFFLPDSFGAGGSSGGGKIP